MKKRLCDSCIHSECSKSDSPISTIVLGGVTVDCIDYKSVDSVKEVNVIKPSNYKAGEFDVIAFCQLHNINFDLGNVIKYVTKGKQILVEGELNIDNYEKDGEKRSFTKVKVDRLEFLGGATTEKKTNTDTLEFTDFQEVDNDEIPF